MFLIIRLLINFGMVVHFAQLMNPIIAYKFKTDIFEKIFSLIDNIQTENLDFNLIDQRLKTISTNLIKSLSRFFEVPNNSKFFQD